MKNVEVKEGTWKTNQLRRHESSPGIKEKHYEHVETYDFDNLKDLEKIIKKYK